MGTNHTLSVWHSSLQCSHRCSVVVVHSPVLPPLHTCPFPRWRVLFPSLLVQLPAHLLQCAHFSTMASDAPPLRWGGGTGKPTALPLSGQTLEELEEEESMLQCALQAFLGTLQTACQVTHATHLVESGLIGSKNQVILIRRDAWWHLILPSGFLAANYPPLQGQMPPTPNNGIFCELIPFYFKIFFRDLISNEQLRSISCIKDLFSVLELVHWYGFT